MWERPQRRDCRGTKAPPTFELAQSGEFFPHQLAAIFFCKGKARLNGPTSSIQKCSRDQRIACVIAFPSKNNAASRVRKKPRDRTRDTGARLIHKRFRRYPAIKRGFFHRAHLRGSQNR